jgi:XRE family transcriptional regulator, regulator of sulfur utilization
MGVSKRQVPSPAGQLFGGALVRMRKERGLSQESLAEKANLTSDYVGYVERGENVPTLIVVLKLAIALDCAPVDLRAEFTPAVLRKLNL